MLEFGAMPPIADPNLKLTLLNAAWEEGLLPRFDREVFLRGLPRESSDAPALGFDGMDARVRNALLDTPLPERVLGQLKLVEWDGGNRIFREIWPGWDGESGEFDVHDLSGIEACTGMESLLFIAGGRFNDISSLSGLRALKELKDFSDPIRDLSPLLSVPALRIVQTSFAPTPENSAVVQALRARGVRVNE